MLGLKSRTTVFRYIRGERVPNGPILARIEQLSGGQVTRSDFLNPEPAQCARIVIDRTGKPCLVYPWTSPELGLARAAANDNRPPTEAHEKEQGQLPPADPWPSRPLRQALDELGSRVRPSVRGGFLLDGRITDARGVVRAANRERVKSGLPPIPYPGVEPLL